MTSNWPDAFCWLYAPFLLENTTAAELEHFALSDNRFKEIVEYRKPSYWAEDDHIVSKAFVGLYKICKSESFFPEWINKVQRKSNTPSLFKTVESTLSEFKNKMKPELYERFLGDSKSLELVSKITGVLDIHHVVNKMDSESLFPTLVKAVKPYLKKCSTFRNWSARSHFLLLLFASDNPLNLCWYKEFLLILITKPTTKLIARYLDSNFEETINQYTITVKQAHIDKVKKIVSFADPMEPLEPRPQSNFGAINLEDKNIENIIKLHDYQYELASKAVSGDNTIICAPTGSGKTFVAAYIIREHLRRSVATIKLRRVVVFAPTIILVEQQTTVFLKLFGSEFIVTSLCGVEPKYATNNVLEVMVGDVIVMTPQVFLNLYMSPVKERKIYIRDFTMMVFDECHNCDKKHPYQIIMKAIAKTGATPQVVGLTASVGAGDAKSANSANVLTHITALSARMGATSISCVQHASNIEEMKAKVPKPVDDFITVAPPERDQFAIKLSDIAQDIELNLEPILKKVADISNLSYDQILFHQRTPCYNGSQRTNVRYISKLASVEKFVKQSSLDKDKKSYAYWLLEFLKKIHLSLRYNELLPAMAAMEYMLEGYEAVIANIKANINACFDPHIKEDVLLVAQAIKSKLEQIESDDNNIRDPKDKHVLNTLIDQIKKQYDTSKKNSQILIFIDLRRGCFDLALFLNYHKLIIDLFGHNKVSYLMSSQTCGKRERFCMSRAEQAKVRSNFEQGIINILVTTSVSDEGVDIASCNLVIKYNSVGNEKTYIQRRGRARAFGSRAVLIALGMNTSCREYNNVFRECIMNRCLHMLATMKSQDVRKEINQAEAIEKNRAPPSNQTHTILCGFCSNIIGETKQLRLLQDNTIVLCNPGIWDKLYVDKLIEKRLNERIVSIRCATAKCAICKHTWGPMVKYADLYLVSPRLDGIRINDIDYDSTKNSWSQLMQNSINVSELQHTDLVAMFNDHLGDKEVELEVAIQQQIRNVIAQNRNTQHVNQSDLELM